MFQTIDLVLYIAGWHPSENNIIVLAFQIIGNLNKELEEQGYLTLRGKVPTKYFVKRFYGVEDTCEIPQEEGKEGPASDA